MVLPPDVGNRPECCEQLCKLFAVAADRKIDLETIFIHSRELHSVKGGAEDRFGMPRCDVTLSYVA